MKRKMSLDNINPALLVLIAGLLSLGAAYMSQTRQSSNSAAMREQLDLNTNLMKEMAAQTGNKDLLRDVIELRSKALSSQAADDDTAKEILARVPKLTEEYRKLKNNEADAAGQLLSEFRVNWEPFIRFVLREFDRRIESVIANGVKLNLKREDAYKVAGIGQEGGNSQLVRVAELNGVELRLYFSSAQVRPDLLSGGSLAVTVRIAEKNENESNPLSIGFHLTEASAEGRVFPAQKGNDLDKELSKIALAGINKGIETLLVLANARAK